MRKQVSSQWLLVSHAPQAIIPFFGPIVCPVTVSQSGVVDIPQDRWKSRCPLLPTGRETPSKVNVRLSKILKQRTSVLWRN